MTRFDDGQTILFTGSGPATTDDSGVYRAQIDVISNFDFPVSGQTVTTRIDGDRGNGVDFVLDSVETGEPRLVIAFSIF